MQQTECDTSFYVEAKRWLHFLSALLVASTFVRVRINENSAIPFVPDEKSGSDSVYILILFFCVLFFIRTLIDWSALPLSFRKSQFNIFSHFTSVCAFFVAIDVYLYVEFRENMLGTWLFYAAYFVSLVLLTVFFHTLGMYPLILYHITHFLAKFENDPEVLERLAIEFDYILYFNPDDTRLRKLIKFERGGKISAGMNKNEFSWRVSAGKLEILNDAGAVYSRFRFRKAGLYWENTNDGDTLSIRNQYMTLKETETD